MKMYLREKSLLSAPLEVSHPLPPPPPPPPPLRLYHHNHTWGYSVPRNIINTRALTSICKLQVTHCIPMLVHFISKGRGTCCNSHYV